MGNEQHCDHAGSPHAVCALLAVCLRDSACVNYDVLPMLAESSEAIVPYERPTLGSIAWLIQAPTERFESVEPNRTGRNTMMNTDVLVAPRRREPS